MPAGGNKKKQSYVTQYKASGRAVRQFDPRMSQSWGVRGASYSQMWHFRPPGFHIVSLSPSHSGRRRWGLG